MSGQDQGDDMALATAHNITLEPSLKTAAAGPLLSALRTYRGSPIALDGSAVEFLGAACFQVLVCASATWRADGVALSVLTPSTAMRNDLTLLGAGNLLSIEGE
ncbi:MAG: STAS domain-containing protein [Pseudomonadota bacterium]